MPARAAALLMGVQMTAPAVPGDRSHRLVGPFYACRYVGVDAVRARSNDPDDVDVVVWLLYEAVPPSAGPRVLDGVLYNRRRRRPAAGVQDRRSDRSVARDHGFGHHHSSRNNPPEQNFRGRTEDAAVRKLWFWRHRNDVPPPTAAGYDAAVAFARAHFVPGSACG